MGSFLYDMILFTEELSGCVTECQVTSWLFANPEPVYDSIFEKFSRSSSYDRFETTFNASARDYR